MFLQHVTIIDNTGFVSDVTNLGHKVDGTRFYFCRAVYATNLVILAHPSYGLCTRLFEGFFATIYEFFKDVHPQGCVC